MVTTVLQLIVVLFAVSAWSAPSYVPFAGVSSDGPPHPGVIPGTGSPLATTASSVNPAPAPTAPPAVTEAWMNVSGAQRISPPALRGGGLVFDPVDNYVVYFGGCAATACPAPAQTWKFVGGAWSNITSTSAQPPARSAAAFAYDSKDGYAVLFGGWGAGGRLLGDTWEFSGGVWTNATGSTTAPSPRGGAGLVYDRSDSYLVLFGGCGFRSCPRADTWQFVGGVWRNITHSSTQIPPARVGASFAWDDHDSYALLFGGEGARGALFADSWQFVGGAWSAVTLNGTSSPSARTNATMGFYTTAGAAYLSRGSGSTGLLTDTWKYQNARWTNETSTLGTTLPARARAAILGSNIAWAGYSAKHVGFIVVFGGGATGCLTCGGPVFNETWVLEPVLTASVSVVPSTVETGQPLQLSAAATGGTAPYLYLWRFGDGASATVAAPVHAYAATGLYSANVSVTDGAGAIYRLSSPVTVVAGPAPALTISTPRTDVGRPIMFSGWATGGVPPYSYRWSFGDLMGAATANATHFFVNPGTYSGNLSAIDSIQGSGVWPFTIMISVGVSLTSSVPSVPIVVGQHANFSAAPSLGTPPYSIDWSFGDGTSSYVPLTDHAYAKSGLYMVHLSVSDSVGWTLWQNFTVRVVNVTATAPPAPLLGLPSWAPWALLAGAASAVAIAAVLLLRRRRLRSRPAPIAAAAAGSFDGETGEDPWHESRQARRRAMRGGRR